MVSMPTKKSGGKRSKKANMTKKEKAQAKNTAGVLTFALVSFLFLFLSFSFACFFFVLGWLRRATCARQGPTSSRRGRGSSRALQASGQRAGGKSVDSCESSVSSVSSVSAVASVASVASAALVSCASCSF